MPDDTLYVHTELPPLTDPAGVTIMSMTGNNFVLDGSTISARLFAYRDLILANFAQLDNDDDELLAYNEASALPIEDVREITHNLNGLRLADFEHLDVSGDGFLSQEELESFRGAGTGFRITSPNNNIIGVTLVNFGDHGILIDGPNAYTNTVQGCNIGVLGTGAQDRAAARALLDGFSDGDGNGDGELTLNEARTISPGLGRGGFNRLDADSNNRLSEAELAAAGVLLDSEIAQLLLDGFDRADSNGNGTLSLEEAQRVVAELATEDSTGLTMTRTASCLWASCWLLSAGDTVGVEGTQRQPAAWPGD